MEGLREKAQAVVVVVSGELRVIPGIAWIGPSVDLVAVGVATVVAVGIVGIGVDEGLDLGGQVVTVGIVPVWVGGVGGVCAQTELEPVGQTITIAVLNAVGDSVFVLIGIVGIPALLDLEGIGDTVQIAVH